MSEREALGRGQKHPDCRCEGTGKLTYHHEHESVEWADGTVVTGSTRGSTPCPCRSSQEPREGEASWWTTEQVGYEVVDFGTGSAEIVVEAEVPYSEDNFKLHRRGNRYYPTMVRVFVDDPIGGYLAPDLRKFSEALARAAAKAEEIDGPDSDECGHWWPCDCPASPSPSSTEGTP